MNKKLLPLLGIAFVVAVIATGIFYGLIVGRLRNASSAGPQIVVAARNLDPGTVLQRSDVRLLAWASPTLPKGAFPNVDQLDGFTVLQPIQENEPMTRVRLASRDASGGAALAIPAGMRAVSIQVPDSPGVLRLLRPGHKVDVQAVRTRGGARGGEAELRTILQGVEVLAVPPEVGQGRSGTGPVLTVLAKPEDAESLGLADAGARIRVVLRNPLDQEKPALPVRNLAWLFDGRSAPLVPRAIHAVKHPVNAPTATTSAEAEVQLSVRVATAGMPALAEFNSRLITPTRSDQFQAAAFRPGWDLDSAMRRFQEKKWIRVLSVSHLQTLNRQQVGVETGRLRVQLLPLLHTGGKVRLRVRPEITTPEGSKSRNVDAEVELIDGQSLLITGLSDPREGSEGSETGHLVVLITPRISRPGPASRSTAALLAKP